jgi:hypothetical protein
MPHCFLLCWQAQVVLGRHVPLQHDLDVFSFLAMIAVLPFSLSLCCLEYVPQQRKRRQQPFVQMQAPPRGSDFRTPTLYFNLQLFDFVPCPLTPFLDPVP